MESLTSHLPKVDDKALEFEVVIKDGQFNLEGRYYLQLSIQSLHTNDYTNIQIRNGSETLFVTNNEGKTDVVQQTEETKLSHFKDNTFFFRLPQGFCKNDKNHDVYLLVEAYSWPKNGGSARKVGEGKFAIYPRPNAPRIKANVNRGDNFYNYTDVLSLLRTTSTDSVQMHCGRIRCTYSLREVVPPKPPKRTPTPTSPMERLNIPSPSPRRSYETPRHDLDKVTPSPRNQTQRSSSPDGQLPHSTRRHVKSPTTSWGDLDNLSMQIPAAPSPPLPPALEGKKMPESPLAESDRKSHFIGNNFRHVARNGKEQVDVIFHGAVSLPTTPSGGAPAPYGVIKSKSADDKNQSIGSATHATSRPTHAPSWEELVFVSMTDPEQAGSEEHPKRILVISVADGPTKQRLVKYEIPMAYLEPFHQYHLELVKPVQGIKSGVRTFVTITRKLEKLPKDPASPNFLGLEAMLTAVKKPFSTPIGPLIAVARLVPDYYNYKSDSLLSHPRTAGVNMTSVTFPEPHPSSFIVPPRTKHGYPQISLPGRPESQPVWNHPYLFCDERDKATLFTPGAALVIEYYIASAAMSEQFWKIRSPIGFSSLLLDKEMYSKLTKPEARQGLRVEGLPIQFLDTLYEIFRDAPVGTEVVDVEGNQPRIGVVLRLITSPEPDTLVIASNIENLPVIDMFPDADTYYRTEGSPDILKVEPNSKEPTMETEDTKLTDRLIPTPPGGGYYLQKKKKRPLSPKVWYKVHETSDGKPIKDGEMPPYEAMETVLPDYQYVFVDPQGKTHQDRRAPPPEPSRPQAPASTTMPGAYSKYAAPAAKPVKYTEDLDKTSVSVLDHQSKELENYRSAVQKMGQDMVALQERIRELENSNSQLRRDLAHYNDASKLMIESSELDGLSKPEVMSRYAALKQTLQTQTGDLKTYKDKVQRLQNELIKKNDDEKNYLANTQKAGSMARNMQVLQEKLAKYKKMEETVKQQEQVIEKMERLLDKQYKERNKKDKDKTNADANEALSAENKRLRAQIQELQEQIKVGGSRSGDDSDKFEMYQALDKAEARIAALERQLQDNSRSWGKERADMSIRLNEAEHGFGRGSGMVLHDYPSYHDTRRNYGPSRYSPKRLSPLYR